MTNLKIYQDQDDNRYSATQDQEQDFHAVSDNLVRHL